MSKIKIGVFSSIRSDFGLQQPIFNEIFRSSQFELFFLVGGAHLLPEFGDTLKYVEASGFPIRHKLNYMISGETPLRDIGRLQGQLADIFSAETPELFILFGDRFELLPLATACLLANIPVAHISGGEVTEGVIDNQVRNALTKMAHLHYPALPEYAENIISMGEEEWRVKAAGEPGLDALSTMNFLKREDFYKQCGMDPNLGFAISTFHPETIHNSITVAELSKIFDRVLADYSGQILVTAANSDHYGKVINDFLLTKSKVTPRFHFEASLGQVNFYSSLKYADFMLGNSSSGIVESQSFCLPVINVGTRQQGRITNENVVHVITDSNAITKAVKLVLSADFKSKVSSLTNRYGRGDSARTILKHIAEHITQPNLLLKKGTFKLPC